MTRALTFAFAVFIGVTWGFGLRDSLVKVWRS